MSDLIRKSDTLAVIDSLKAEFEAGGSPTAAMVLALAREHIADLPAVTVCDCRVRDLIEFLEEHPDNIHFLPVDQLQILRERIAALLDTEKKYE